MDQDTQNRFDTLRTTDPNAWSAADREFMTARRDYLSEDEQNAFGMSEAEADPAPKAKKKADPAE